MLTAAAVASRAVADAVAAELRKATPWGWVRRAPIIADERITDNAGRFDISVTTHGAITIHPRDADGAGVIWLETSAATPEVTAAALVAYAKGRGWLL